MTWPRYQTYRERLTPDAPPIEVELPQSRDDVFDLLATLGKLAASDPVAWKALYRQYAVCDWYILAHLLSAAQRVNPYTGRPWLDCDFQFTFSREMQFDSDGVIDKSARGIGKTFWRGHVGIISEILRDPNITIGMFAFEKAAAEKNGGMVKDELAINPELKINFAEVLWDNPDREATLWSREKGLTVKRTIVASMPTLSWHSIVGLPTGARFSLVLLDDIENEDTVATEEMRTQTMGRVKNAFNLAGLSARWWINGTHHHPNGVIAQLERAGGWKVRCHKAEDDTKPAPDIAALYDECNGEIKKMDEVGGVIRLPPDVRHIRLAGEPVFWPALVCAERRLSMGAATYSSHNMGDAVAGQDRRLQTEWIRRYPGTPREWARGANLYILVDPSKGQGDPTFARVEACKADETISWVGGLRKRLTPSEFGPAIYQLAMEWMHIGRLVEIRVEEFGQSTWQHMLRSYFETCNHFVCPIVACGRHTFNNRESEGRQREWAGLEPLYRMQRRLYPKEETGLWVQDETGRSYDLVAYYLKEEYGLFPLPNTDDGLAADYLLAVKTGRNEAGKPIDLELQFPDDEEESERAERSAGRWARRPRDPEQDCSWMVQGFMG